jgi:ribosomal protein S18 acetylase RimI-like enzyme
LEFEIIDIRRFDAEAFLPLLNQEAQAWLDELRWDFTASMRVITNCLRDKRLSGYALVHGNEVWGYCFFFYDGEKGLIGDLFVDSSFGRTGQAERLLQHVIETLQATPGIRRVEAQLPHFGYEELQSCFTASNFKCYARRFMAVSLNHWGGLRSLSPPRSQRSSNGLSDFLILPWDRKHSQDAPKLLHDVYRTHVDAILNDQYSSLAGATRLIENIVHQQGCGEFLPRMSRAAIHRATQQLAGILAVTSVRTHTAHIPQIAIAKKFQGCGLGSAMIDSSFRDLAKLGYQEVSLTVTDANAGAVRLYERLGFESFRAFGAFVYDHR